MKKTIKYFSNIILIFFLIFSYHVYIVFSYSKKKLNQRVDAAIVLGAAAWGVNPSPVFKERINHAIDLYKKGYCDYIIFTGGPGDPSEPGESVIAKRYAIKNGIDDEYILLENKSKNTVENIYYAYQISRQYKFKTFVLISDPYHLKRAAMIAEQFKMKVFPSATPTSRFITLESQLNFLCREAYFLFLYRVELLLKYLNILS